MITFKELIQNGNPKTMIFITIYHQKFSLPIIIYKLNHHIIKIRKGKFYSKSGEIKNRIKKSLLLFINLYDTQFINELITMNAQNHDDIYKNYTLSLYYILLRTNFQYDC